MKPLSLPAISSTLEVERKFCSLAVRELTAHGGNPQFNSIRSLGQWNINDVYYDRSKLLSSAGIWLRQRNGRWEAKLKRGGNFTNSRFEEFSNPHDISRCVRGHTGIECAARENFGLEPIATLSTIRKAWIVDGEFRVVSDTMDFGHTVGEVELQQQVNFKAATGLSIEQQKLRVMQDMDDRIAKFMERYSWAFCLGVPKGKLTAYFERKAI